MKVRAGRVGLLPFLLSDSSIGCKRNSRSFPLLFHYFIETFSLLAVKRGSRRQIKRKIPRILFLLHKILLALGFINIDRICF
jgi:hypothetical protein